MRWKHRPTRAKRLAGIHIYFSFQACLLNRSALLLTFVVCVLVWRNLVRIIQFKGILDLRNARPASCLFFKPCMYARSILYIPSILGASSTFCTPIIESLQCWRPKYCEYWEHENYWRPKHCVYWARMSSTGLRAQGVPAVQTSGVLGVFRASSIEPVNTASTHSIYPQNTASTLGTPDAPPPK